MNARYATSTDSGGTARTAWLMTVLFLASLLNFADRAVFSVLAQTIKVDLRLSDLELGLLQGLLFALLYGLAGLPVGMLAERVRRTSLIAAATAIWSLATAATGLAAGFVQLAAARLAVGFGEAGFTPAAASLVADVTPPQRRSSMIALVQLGSPAGAFLGATIAGAIAAASSWRMSFVAFAVPGLVVAALLHWLVAEPKRGQQDGAAAPVAQPMAGQPKLDAQERKAVVSDDRGATEDAFRDKAPGGKDQADSALRADAAGKRADAPAESVEVLATPAPPPPPAPPAPAAPQSVIVAEPPVVYDEPVPFPEPKPAEPAAAAAGAPARDEELRFQQLKKEAAEGERAQSEAPGGLDSRGDEKRRRESAASTEAAEKAAAAPVTGSLSRQAAPATATGVLGATAPADRRDADAATFERVRELVRAGRRDDARKALREFRKAHPDATIPDDLRDLLR